MRVEGLAGTTILRTMSGCGGLPRSVGDASSSLVISPEQLSECDWNPFASLEQHLDLYVPTIFSPYAHGGRENLWIGSSNGHPDKQVLGVEVSGDGKKDMPPPVLPEDDSRARGSLDRTGSLLSDEELGRGKRPKGKKRGRMPELGALDPVSSCNRIQNMAVERKDDVEKDVREHSPGNSAQKLTSEQAKGNSSSGDDQKEGSANTRAKRGHATNSHSLAERVRREKISQRMKFLQDLVPGCSKITGKAVMLDEIINYVQSLQQQVEFLSMKLATVDPETQFRTGRDLSPDVIYPQAGNPGVPVIGGGANYSHFHVQGANQHGAWQGQMSAGVWNANLRSSKNVSLNSNAHIDATNQSLGERHGGPL